MAMRLAVPVNGQTAQLFAVTGQRVGCAAQRISRRFGVWTPLRHGAGTQPGTPMRTAENGGERRRTVRQGLTYSDRVADRAGEAIEADDNQGLAGTDITQEAGEHGAGAIGTGGVLLAYRVAAGSAPLVELGIGALFLGGDPCVADQTACDGSSPAACTHSALVAFPHRAGMYIDLCQ